MTLLERKHRALDVFLHRLLGGQIKDHIAKVILFGSVAKGKAQKESDIDVLIVALDHLEEIGEVSVDASIETGMETEESIEPLVCTIDEIHFLRSYFIYNALRLGKEVYTMDPVQLKRSEAEQYLRLSREYLDGAKRLAEEENYRIGVDAGYNAAELALKGLLLFKLDDMPTTHGGLVHRFGDLYVRTGEADKQITRALGTGMKTRNEARYRYDVIIVEEHFVPILALATTLQNMLAEKIEEAV